MLFLLKKTVGPLFYPLSVCILILILGLVFLCFTKRQRTGKSMVFIGVLLLFLSSMQPVADIIVRPLEYKYPSFHAENIHISEGHIKWIVVLGGGHTSDSKIPASAQISQESLVRLIEAIHLYRTIPDTKIILTGGALFDPVTEAEATARVAEGLGVKRGDIVFEDQSKDTDDQARLVKNIVNNDRFLLVTSAAHMPRSMALFKKQGLNPIPAPTGHLVKENDRVSPKSFYPESENLYKIEAAIHEYLGLVWAKARGQI